jgi:hypothetical protein
VLTDLSGPAAVLLASLPVLQLCDSGRKQFFDQDFFNKQPFSFFLVHLMSHD